MDVDVWLGDPALVDDERAQQLSGILSNDERRRAARFMRHADRQAYITAHALVRDALSHYADRSPREWRFVTEARGKPSIVADQRPRGITFNLTHTRGLVACAVGFGAAIGIDAEAISRALDKRVERSVLLARERALLDAAGVDRQARFFEFWTCKEAVAKALGLGLHLAFESFGIALGPARIAELPPTAPGAADLCLGLAAPLPTHRLAVAAVARGPLTLHVRRSARVPTPQAPAFSAVSPALDPL